MSGGEGEELPSSQTLVLFLEDVYKKIKTPFVFFDGCFVLLELQRTAVGPSG